MGGKTFFKLRKQNKLLRFKIQMVVPTLLGATGKKKSVRFIGGSDGKLSKYHESRHSGSKITIPAATLPSPSPLKKASSSGRQSTLLGHSGPRLLGSDSQRSLSIRSFGSTEESKVEDSGEEDRNGSSKRRTSREENADEKRWICTLCTKENAGRLSKCGVCARVKGFVGDAFLPFHPPAKSIEGAARFLDYRKIRAYLLAGVDPNIKDSSGWTGIHWAAALSRVDLIKMYLEFNGDINIQREDGWTPLHLACLVGDEECVLFLLQRGANPDIMCTRDGYAPLHVAAKEDHKECIEALGLAGANLNAKSEKSGFTALHIASLCGHMDCVNSLILVSSDPLRTCKDLPPVDLEQQDNDGWDAFHLAKLRKHEDVAKLIEANMTKQRRLSSYSIRATK